jgi:hypothetical protein
MPEIDKETGQPAFDLDLETISRRYRALLVPLAADQILAVKPGYVVTIDGQKLRCA